MGIGVNVGVGCVGAFMGVSSLEGAVPSVCVCRGVCKGVFMSVFSLEGMSYSLTDVVLDVYWATLRGV